MDARINDMAASYRVFAWVAFAAGLILLIPFVAMQVTSEVNWGLADFAVMGILLFSAGSSLVLIWKLMSRNRRILLSCLVSAAFFYIWAELAVGVLLK